MHKTPYFKIHGAYSKYVEMTAQYINGCTGDTQIIPVTMFLVMLYNACFMFQINKKPNMLITAVDMFDLRVNIDHELFVNTLSKYKNPQQIQIWKILFLILSYCQCELSQ